MLPALSNAGRRAPSDSSGGAAADALVLAEEDGVALALGDLDLDDLVVEQAVLLGLGGALVDSCRRARPAGHAAMLGGARRTSRCRRPWRTWSMAQNRPSYIIESTTALVAHAVAGPGLGQQVRRVGHGLHAAGDDDVGLAGLDLEVGQVDGVEARQADLVDRGGRHDQRDAGLHRGLAGGHLAGAGRAAPGP